MLPKLFKTFTPSVDGTTQISHISSLISGSASKLHEESDTRTQTASCLVHADVLTLTNVVMRSLDKFYKLRQDTGSRSISLGDSTRRKTKTALQTDSDVTIYDDSASPELPFSRAATLHHEDTEEGPSDATKQHTDAASTVCSFVRNINVNNRRERIEFQFELSKNSGAVVSTDEGDVTIMVKTPSESVQSDNNSSSSNNGSSNGTNNSDDERAGFSHSLSLKFPTNKLREKRIGGIPLKAHVHGSFVLAPARFGCTYVTLTLSCSDVAHTDILNDLLTVLPTLHDHFARDDEVDEAQRYHFVNVEMPNAPPLKLSEQKLFDLVGNSEIFSDAEVFTGEVGQRSTLKNHGFSRIPGTVNGRVAYFQKIESNLTGGWGKGIAEVDAPASTTLAWLWCADSNERERSNRLTDPGAFREWLFVPNSHSLLYVFLMHLGGALAARLITLWLVWRVKNGVYELSFTDMEEHGGPSLDAMNSRIAADPRANKAVRGFLRGRYLITPLAPNVCRVVVVSQGVMNGSIPVALLNLRIKNFLDTLATLQERFQRGDKVVDTELREAYPTPPTLGQLNADQSEMLARCQALEIDDADIPWEDITSPSVFVKMQMKRASGKRRRGRGVALGMAESVIDVPAKVALAWVFNYCSRIRNSISNEEGNLARLIHSEASPHDNIVATIKAMPSRFKHREFVSRQLAVRGENSDEFLYIVEPVDVDVDYGFSARVVRGMTMSITRITGIGKSQCKVVLLQHLDANGHIPVKLVNHFLPNSLMALEDLRSTFQRDNEIDGDERDELSQIMRNEEQTYSHDEIELFERVAAVLAAGIKEDGTKEVANADNFVKISWSKVNGSVGVGKATTVIDASPENCAVWEMAKMSRENMKLHSDFGGLQRSLSRLNSHSKLYHVVYKGGFAIKPREWVQKQLWRQNETGLLVIYESLEHADIPVNLNYVRARTTVLYEFEKLNDIEGVAQTRVTLTQRIDLGGALPKGIVDSVAVSSLTYLSTMRLRFDQSLKIDAAVRMSLANSIINHNDAYSNEENEFCEKGETFFSLFEGKKAKNLAMDSRLAKAKVAFKSGDSYAWGWASTVVRASTENVLAYSWNTMSRDKRRDDDLEKAVDENLNGHNQMIYNKKKTPKIVHDRDFLGRAIWKKTETGFFLVTVPQESGKRPPVPGVVRAKYPSYMKIIKVNDKETRVSYVIHPDFGGGVPAFLMNLYIAKNLRKVSEAQEYFQSLRGLEVWGAKDGEAVGVAMLIKTKAEKHRKEGETKEDARIRELTRRYKGLREIEAKYEFFPGMMARLVQNKLRPANETKTKLCNVTIKEGKTMGAGLSFALAGNLTSEAAVDEWILRYTALKELDREEVWFRPMINGIAKQLLSEVSWGLKFRLLTGSSLSIMDMASDIYVITEYFGKPNLREFGMILLGMILTSVGIQLISAVLNTKKTGWAKVFEVIVILAGLRVPYDAYHVITDFDAENDTRDNYSSKTKLAWSKSIEMFAEAIPGTVLQVYAALNQAKKGQVVSRQALASIAISAVTTGFTSATISYDNDTDPAERQRSPEFYGFVPDRGLIRTVLLLCMTMNSALLLLIRSLSVALLMLFKPSYFVWLWAMDLTLFLMQRKARGDFTHHFPVYGFRGFLIAFFTRLVVKGITDYTGIVDFRHPLKLGGIFWSLNVALGILICNVVAKLYYSSVPKEVVLPEGDFFTLLWSLIGAWGASFAFFFMLIKKEYRSTFFSTKLGKHFTMELFFSKDDATRFEIFKWNEFQWKEIREEVKAWVLLNWWDWQDEKPEWLKDSIVARIPQDFIPDEEGRQIAEDARARKGSVLSLFVGKEESENNEGRKRGSAAIVPVEG